MSNAAYAVMGVLSENPDEPINIIGHSWGGSRATRLANELNGLGVTPEFVVTVDPVSPIGRRRDVESQGTTWLNFYVERSERNMASFPDQVAVSGGAWRYRQNADSNFPITYDMYSKTPFGTVPSGHMDILNINFSQFFDALYGRNLDR